MLSLDSEAMLIAFGCLQGYRVISGLVAREWCLMEICSKLDIINLVTDPKMEMTKLGTYLGRLMNCDDADAVNLAPPFLVFQPKGDTV